MLTGKERAALRAAAQRLDAIFQVGKAGVTPELTQAVDEALEAREMVKLSVLGNCELAVGDAADTLRGRTRSEVVQVVGRKFVLYRKKKEQFGGKKS